MSEAVVLGAGLAGCEAAWALAKEGVSVRLVEMKPEKKTPAHRSDGFAELVCSNSLKAKRLGSAAGMLKEEMRVLGSLVMEAAEKNEVSAGGALAVDREGFSEYITEKIKSAENIEIVCKEVLGVPDDEYVVVATGPLTSDALFEDIKRLCGESLHFYDAAAPIVDAETLDMTKIFRASRYDRGEADYLNCPMSKDEYLSFREALVNAESVPVKKLDSDLFSSDDFKVYEGCMPIEVLAKRGEDTMRFGPLKPVGLKDPRTGLRPYAVVQLRAENKEGRLFNLVGFQTNLRFGEQKRVLALIPGLENAEITRYGVMHRNTFINSPALLTEHFNMRSKPNVFFAGQITGVEGYTESAASGILAGRNLARVIKGDKPLSLPRESMLGALSEYISDESVTSFQPMGANMGILPPLEQKIKCKADRYQAFAERGVSLLKQALSGY